MRSKQLRDAPFFRIAQMVFSSSLPRTLAPPIHQPSTLALRQTQHRLSYPPVYLTLAISLSPTYDSTSSRAPLRPLLTSAFFSTFAHLRHLIGAGPPAVLASPSSPTTLHHHASILSRDMSQTILCRDWSNLRIFIATEPWVVQVTHQPTGLSGRILLQSQNVEAPLTHPRGTFFLISGSLQGYRATIYLYRDT